MVALLGLVVGGVVIANSVALTTMERRREIAVMKSVGLQRERVLGMLLLENGILGFIGGLLGVGISLLALIILLAVGGGLVIPYGTALLLMLLCVLVALIAAGTTAWGASGEKPLNVLRYE
jgi:putative ABC transport system permease protein